MGEPSAAGASDATGGDAIANWKSRGIDQAIADWAEWCRGNGVTADDMGLALMICLASHFATGILFAKFTVPHRVAVELALDAFGEMVRASMDLHGEAEPGEGTIQ